MIDGMDDFRSLIRRLGKGDLAGWVADEYDALEAREFEKAEQLSRTAKQFDEGHEGAESRWLRANFDRG